MLLDTHIFLWWLFNDPQLPEGVLRRIKDPHNRVFVSAASVWEISTKYRIGKLPDAAKVANNVPDWIVRAGFQALSVTPAHALLAGSWKTEHRDPFDRMLAAQARIEKIPLATSDSSLKNFPVKIIFK